jgi:GLPGLI family protein
MKNVVVICFVVLFLPSIYAQKKGVVRYEVTAEKRDSSVDAIMSAALLKKSEFTFTFKKKRRERVELKAGTYFDFVTIFDYKKGKFLRLTDDQKKKVANEGNIFVSPDSVFYMKSIYTLLEDTMTILGYKCYKATKETRYGQLTCWYTKEIKHNFKGVDFIQVDVPGMPLYFMSNSDKVKMTFKAIKVDKLKREDRKALRYKIPEDYILGPSLSQPNEIKKKN